MNASSRIRLCLATGCIAAVSHGLWTSCVPAPTAECAVDADCDDGNACDGIEACESGACVAGTPLDCNDDDPCTTDRCIEGACENAPDLCPDDCEVDADCDDGDPCTSDTCSGGACANVNDLCPEPTPKLVFWSETIGEDCASTQVRTRSTDGGAIDNLVTLVSPDSVQGLAVDVPGDAIYWSLSGSSANCDDRIQRSDLAGGGLDSLIIFGTQPECNSRPSPLDIALDVDNGRFFWMANGGCSPCPGVACTACSAIRRADLDGSPVSDVLTLTGTNNPSDIALDIAAGKMYWTDRQFSPSIFRADLDGSDMEPLVESSDGADEIALDLVNGRMYWIQSGGSIPCDTGCPRIRSANLDGSGQEDVVVFENQPDFDASEFYRGLAVDPQEGKIYWGVGGFCPIDALTGRIQRADLDGNNVEDIVTGLGIVGKVVVVAAPE